MSISNAEQSTTGIQEEKGRLTEKERERRRRALCDFRAGNVSVRVEVDLDQFTLIHVVNLP